MAKEVSIIFQAVMQAAKSAPTVESVTYQTTVKLTDKQDRKLSDLLMGSGEFISVITRTYPEGYEVIAERRVTVRV